MAALAMTDDSRTAITWSDRYGLRHRLLRISQFPPGITPPVKVRVYTRRDHFVLQWWDPAAKATLSDRVDGDLVAAISRAREVDTRLSHFRRSGTCVNRRLSHSELVSAYVADLSRRADAGEIDPRSCNRYQSALANFTAFCTRPGIHKQFPTATGVNREFRLAFAAFLAERRTVRGKQLTGKEYVMSTVRSMYEWAADPDRGGLLPDGFRNPFRRANGTRALLRGDPLAPPDITVNMAVEMIAAADSYQLKLLSPIVLFGLRAAEPCLLFAEHLRDNWLRVACLPELDLLTKGRRDKSLPLIEDLKQFWGFFT